MKSERPLSETAARVLRDEAQQDLPIAPENRAAAIDGMVRAMRQRTRRRRFAIGGSIALAAAVLLALGALAAHRPAVVAVAPVVVSSPPATVLGAATVTHADAILAAGAGAEVAAGDRVVVADEGRATMSLPKGTRVILEANTIVELAAAFPATTIALTTGSLHADVAKLAGAERFIVRTDDAEVEVRGTSFDVDARVPGDPSCGAGTTTRVFVREGVVAVHVNGQLEALIHANEVWPSGCDAAVTATPPTSMDQPSTAPSVAPAPPKSDLAAQNDLFERATTKKRAGDVPGALAAYDQLIARYPSSHLSQSARAERMKLLVGVDHAKARAAARDYLTRYPSGYARADAELILSSPD